MPSVKSAETVELQAVPAAREIAADDWNACANPVGLPYNPFLAHAFFLALEESRSASPRAGWGAQHLIARDEGKIVGIVPCYLKSHSQGEYVFDHGWADAYERAGGSYYPKLQASVPFTPATGRRLLVANSKHTDRVAGLLAEGLASLCKAHDASSVHVTFAPEDEWNLLSKHGFLQRTDRQFHWRNEGYGTFDDFLATLSSRYRKVIKRERRDALANGISIHALSGAGITEEVLDAFFDFYTETGSRKWGRPYLTRDFYARVAATMADDILLVMAKRGGRWIAGAINFIGSDTLFGRHWGAIEHHPFLHFEVCYYQAIDYAIAHRKAGVEAGAQGQHKIARGYLPQTTYSAHYIPDPSFRRAVDDFLRRERQHVAESVRVLSEAGPFRRDA